MDRKYSREEREELDRLMITVINDYGKLDWFYDLYKKYVDGGARRPEPGCGTCGASIETYFSTFREWYVQNGNLFE